MMHMKVKRRPSPSVRDHQGTNSTKASSNTTRNMLCGLFAVCVALVGWQTTYMTPSTNAHLYSSSLEAYLPPGMTQASNSNPTGIPQGIATVFPPSLDTEYGLNALPIYDRSTVSPAVFKNVVQLMNARSIIDVGCGRGYASTWWDFHNVTTITSVDRYRMSMSGTDRKLIERGKNADNKTRAQIRKLIKKTKIVQVRNSYTQHDYALGPWWPSGPTYDIAWALDVVPHISLDRAYNYMQTFRKAAVIIVSWTPYWPSTSRNANTTKRELHSNDWWRQKFESQGFLYRNDWTAAVRDWAAQERRSRRLGPDGQPLNARHLWMHTHVFVNPVVMSLSRHQHLLPDPHDDTRNNEQLLNTDMDIAWTNYWQNRVTFPSREDPAVEARWRDVHANFVETEVTASNIEGEVAKVAGKDPKIPSLRTMEISPDAIPVVPLLQQFERKEFPNVTIGGTRNTQVINPISVVAWPYLKVGVRTAEHLHVEEDGINQSPYLEMSPDLNDFSETVVWVGDIGCCSPNWVSWCQEYASVAQLAQEKRRELGKPLHWPIFIVDFTDGVELPHCPAIEAIVGTRNVKYTTRSVGVRLWDTAKNWTKMAGQLGLNRYGHQYLHTPLVVRTDTIVALDKDLRNRHSDRDGNIELPLTLASPLERMNRPIDVSHFWPVGDQSMVGTQGRVASRTSEGRERLVIGGSMVTSSLRTRVGDILTRLQMKHAEWNFFLGIKGSTTREGRRGVKETYIEGLLESKIVVVTQRDYWEDHYRLMEALVGGAMVMTDRMVGLPKGLKNGTSVIEFDSAASLENLVTYYLTHPEERLAIAKAGRYVAMARHRTWHRMEEIIFGRVLSNCQYQPAGSMCPYVVTGHESQR